MFFKRKNETASTNPQPISSAEYERLSNRIVEIHSTLKILATDIKVLETNLDNLRGKFNQRLKNWKEEEKVEEKQINTSNELYFG